MSMSPSDAKANLAETVRDLEAIQEKIRSKAEKKGEAKKKEK